ncbi:MAG: Cation efflux system protein heavy metal resistance [Pseudomonadota bacterium]|jgi:cobalt-zinc-cadmium efflux system outer membrane protein
MRRISWPLGLAAALLSPCLAGAQPAPSASASAPSPAQAASAVLTLAQALELAQSRSLQVSAGEHELAAAEAALQQAGSRRNPELAASVEDTRTASMSTTAMLAYPIELGGKRAARVAVAERTLDAVHLERDLARAQVRGATLTAFFATLVAQERMRLAAGSLALAESGAHLVERRVAAGKVSPVEATRARVDLAQAQLEVSGARAELDAARHTLAALWGEVEPGFDSVMGDAAEIPARPPMAELLLELPQTPAVQLARSEVARRRSQIELERSRAVPDMTVSLGLKRNNELGRLQAMLGLSVPLAVFDRNQGAILEAARRADRAEDEATLVLQRLRAELQTASTQLGAAREALQLLQTTVLPAAQQAHEAATKGFEAGKFGFIDVIDAQRALLAARIRTLNTLSTAYQAAATIDRLLGH